MRVALLVTDLQRGGTPLRLARLARGLRDARVEVVVGSLAARGPVSDALEQAGIRTFACDATRGRSLSALLRLGVRIKQHAPDLIHSALTHANVAARLIGQWTGIPVLSSTATIEVERPLHLRLERWTAGWDRGHIVASSAIAEHVERTFRVPRARIHLIPPGVEPPVLIDRADARRRLDLPPDAFVVAWAGRFDPVKRIHLAIEAVAVNRAWHLLLAGDGPLRRQLEERTRELCRTDASLARRIHILGWQDDLGPTLSAADAFVLPSRTEGVPNALLQAMAAGLPCVASAIPATHALEGEPARMLLVPGAAAADYAGALQRLCDDPGLCQSLGVAAREYSHSLTWGRCIAASIELYQRFARTPMK